MQTPSLIVLGVTSKNGNPLSNNILEPLALALTRHHGRYSTVTPQRALASVGGWPLHTAVINL